GRAGRRGERYFVFVGWEGDGGVLGNVGEKGYGIYGIGAGEWEGGVKRVGRWWGVVVWSWLEKGGFG
ncbi:hypothetical protein, partial [Bacillus subtilis]|uniref:hypothetical protein n=1 Tax=Bacillus subtilis TaxID=1423 RepID=UPI001BDBA06C